MEVKSGQCWRRTLPAPTSVKTTILSIYLMETSDSQGFSCREGGKQVADSGFWWQEAAEGMEQWDGSRQRLQGRITLPAPGAGKQRHGCNLSSWKFLLLPSTAQLVLEKKTWAQPFPGPPFHGCSLHPLKSQRNWRKPCAPIQSFGCFLNVIPRKGIYGRCKDGEDCSASNTPRRIGSLQKRS